MGVLKFKEGDLIECNTWLGNSLGYIDAYASAEKMYSYFQLQYRHREYYDNRDREIPTLHITRRMNFTRNIRFIDEEAARTRLGLRENSAAVLIKMFDSQKSDHPYAKLPAHVFVDRLRQFVWKNNKDLSYLYKGKEFKLPTFEQVIATGIREEGINQARIQL